MDKLEQMVSDSVDHGFREFAKKRSWDTLIILMIFLATYFLGYYSGYKAIPEVKPQTPTVVPIFQDRPQNQATDAKIWNVSGYCQGPCCCGEFADGITASGHKIQPGDVFVAAPKSIPFGTKLWIPGYNGGKAVSVLDRGGAIKGNKLDVFFGGKDGHQKALQFGRQYLQVKFEK